MSEGHPLSPIDSVALIAMRPARDPAGQRCGKRGGSSKKVEVLYVAECPSHPAAVKLVRDVLNSEGVAAEIREVLVRDDSMATDLAFSGSPTIRINGRDVAGESPQAKAFALSCRLYPGSAEIGLPPVEMVRRAIVEAREGNAC